MSSSTPALRVDGLHKRYSMGTTGGLYRYRSLREDLAGAVRRRRPRPGSDELWAVDDVSFEIADGEAVGLIGRNGAGKSTLLKLLSKVTPPTRGRIEIKGRLGALLEVGTGFHPELTGRENIFLSGSILGMRRHEIVAKLDEIVEFSGIARFLDTPVKRYSSGMYLRLAFAVAAHLEPDVLLVDEVLAVGDATFQQKCLGKMAEVGGSGRTVVFVSHNMAAISRLCDRVLLLDGGRLVADGSTESVIRRYLEIGSDSTTAQRTWADLASAPGDDVARLRSISVRHADGLPGDEFDVREPVIVEIEYERLDDDPELRTTASFMATDEAGVVLFVSADFVNRPAWERPAARGLVRSRCTIPPNLLAEGRISLMVSVTSLSPAQVIHAREDDAVAFSMVDRSQGDGVRGQYGGDWPGVVRPMLPWTVERVEGSTEMSA